jgi:hypothetical protein
MKKFLILLAAICCCGCSSSNVTKEEPTQNTNIKLYYKDLATVLYTAEIEGHLYVIYSGTYKGGIIHAEHCPCKMK